VDINDGEILKSADTNQETLAGHFLKRSRRPIKYPAFTTNHLANTDKAKQNSSQKEQRKT